MRKITLFVFCLVAVGAVASSAGRQAPAAPASSGALPPVKRALELVHMAADSLVVRHRAVPTGGWAWQSSIQAPHYQTDRDVGAASIGEGLLAAYSVTQDKRYLHAAAKAGDFLIGVAEPAAGGWRWPDWVDPDGRRSDTHFTSFDDGVAGISDYLWRLSEVTHDRRFRAGALAGMRWLLAQAKGSSCPETSCTWTWTDDPGSRVAYYGVGMGQAGIVWALDLFADRTRDPRFRRYARAGAARLRQLTADGARPLPEGTEGTVAPTGYLSGSAGAASMFLERYAHDRNPVDLATARALLRELSAGAIPTAGGLRWRLSDDDAVSSPGFELGVAGIAWANLQAYRLLHDRRYFEVARRAGVWLRSVAIGGRAWAEQPGDPDSPVHVGLDSGAAGIGWVLDDLARAGLDPSLNHAAAHAVLDWLQLVAGRDSRGAFWYENRTQGRNQLRAEPSWHWGAAGIGAFAARLAGWIDVGPAGQPLTH